MKLLNIILFFFLSFFSINNLNANEKVSVLLNWKHQFEFAGFYAAIEQGYYKEAGLDVKLIEYSEDKDSVNEIINDDVQYATTYSSLINEYIKGKPVVFLANFLKKSPLIFVVNQNITSPIDLKGKKVMAVSNEFDTLNLILNKFNLDINDIKKVPSTFNISDFIDNKVDAAAIYSTNELYQLSKKGIKYNILDPTFFGIHHYDLNLFTSRKEFTQNPNRVKKFTEATIKGWKYALSNKNEIINLIQREYNSQNKSKDTLLFEAKQIEQLMLTSLYEVGSIDKLRVQLIIDSFLESGTKDLRADKDLNSFIYNKNTANLLFTQEENDYIKNNTFKMGFIVDYYPFSFKTQDKAYGYSLDYLELIKKKSNLNIEYTVDNWSKLLKKFKNKELDIIDGISYKKEREAFTNFTNTYYNIPNAIFVRKDSIKNYTDIKSLKGKKVGVTKDIFYLDKIKELDLFEIIEFNTSKEKMKALAFGKIDVVFNSLISGKRYIKQAGYSNIIILDELSEDIINQEDLRLGIKKEDKLLLSIIKKSINAISVEEKMHLNNKWFEPKKINQKNSIKLSVLEQDYLSSKKEIKMCVDPNWMPIEKIEGNTHIGLVADYIKIFSKMINTPINLVKTTSWDESIRKAKKRECDIFSLASKTPERKIYMDFTVPYLDVPIVMATKIGIPFIENLNQVKNKKIGLVKGYSLINRIKGDFPNIKVIEVDSLEDGLKKVHKGEIFGYIDNSIVINYSIQRNYLGSLAISGKFFDKFKMNIATRNDEKILNDIFNKVILSLDKDTEHQLNNKWTNIQFEKSVDYSLLIKIFVVVFLVFAFFAYRHFIQSKNNQKLYDANNQLKAILDTTLEAIIIFTDSSIIDINNESVKLFGSLDKKDLMKKRIYDFIPNKYKDKAIAYLNNAQNEATELELLKVNGDKFPALVRSSNISINNKKITVLSIVDLSDVKDKESMILHQSKMASMGEMLNNIAHQWRQPLSIITTYSSGLKLNAEYENLEHKDIIDSADAITKQAQYLSQTIEEFRNYFKADENLIVRFNLKQTILKIENLIHESFIANKIKVVSKPQDISIYSNEPLLVQAIINISNNVKDIIQKRETHTTSAYFFIDVQKEKDTLVISLKDSAGGIDNKIMDKIFEPYFTTKHQSVGTGIGLYMTYQIITKQLLGSIKVKNTHYVYQGKKYTGAEFIIKIPMTRD